MVVVSELDVEIRKIPNKKKMIILKRMNQQMMIMKMNFYQNNGNFDDLNIHEVVLFK